MLSHLETQQLTSII